MAEMNKPPKHRSPSYPSSGLEACVTRARVVWDKQMRADTSADTLCRYWGVSGTSGTGLSVMAAMKAYGLLEAVGKGASTWGAPVGAGWTLHSALPSSTLGRSTTTIHRSAK